MYEHVEKFHSTLALSLSNTVYLRIEKKGYLEQATTTSIGCKESIDNFFSVFYFFQIIFIIFYWLMWNVQLYALYFSETNIAKLSPLRYLHIPSSLCSLVRGIPDFLDWLSKIQTKCFQLILNAMYHTDIEIYRQQSYIFCAQLFL